jgi:Amt family ammonium transporter
MKNRFSGFLGLVIMLSLMGMPGFAAAEETAAAVVTQTVNKGDTAWMIVATVLVILMVIPGLALFYGGMVRTKNMLSVLMQVFIIFSMMAVLWAIYGYSVAFTEGNAFFGGLSKLFLKGITPDSMAATFSKGAYVPEFIYVAFQLTFAAITPALIIGAFAERVKFSAVLVLPANRAHGVVLGRTGCLHRCKSRGSCCCNRGFPVPKRGIGFCWRYRCAY